MIRTQKGLSIMRKFLILLFLAAVTAFSVSGCGGGSSGDPLGTDSITFTGAGSVVRNGTLLLTATVKSASGAAVAGRDVTFGIVTNESAATLSAGEARTDSDGVTTVIYRAGGVSGVDRVRASISNNPSAYRDVAITVGTGGAGEVTLNVTPTMITLAAGAQTIITAQVLNEDGQPAAGQTVTFTTAPSGSGALDPTPSSSTTNAAGKAFATYTAGSSLPGSTVFDVVTASVTTAGGSAAGEVLITRTAAAAGGPTVNITSSLSSLRAGSQAIITADVLNPDGTPAAGQTVTFTTAPNNSGAALLPASGTTNAAGKAFATYTAGNSFPGTTVYDVVTASITGASSGIIITRTAAGAAGVTMTVTASLESLAAGSQSLITAEVLNADGTPATGQTVTFATDPDNSSGTLLPAGGGITNADGKAFATYTAGSNLPGTTVFDVVTASVTGAAGDAADSKIIARTAAAAAGFTMTITPSLTTLSADSQSIITARVLNADGTPAVNQTVTFTIAPNNSTATIPATGTTNADGKAFVTYTAGSNSLGATVFDVVTASVTGAAASTIITRTAAYYITITASPTTLAADGSNSVITATVKNNAGTAISGVTVNFAVTGVVPLGTLSVASATTDGNGNAVTTFTGNGASATGATSVVTASITVSGNTYTNAVIITYP